jgi:hypothetical protein
MQSFEYSGFWWDPRAPENKWPGTLRFEPATGAVLKRLVARFRNAQQPAAARSHQVTDADLTLAEHALARILSFRAEFP